MVFHNWTQVADWYDSKGFIHAAEAARDRYSDLRRFGNLGLISWEVTIYYR